MRIATWNVNGLRARMDFVTHWLKRREPDVVGLQEVKVSDEDFPHDDFRALGYHAVVHGEKGWNGVAVLSRTPAEADTRGLPGREDDGARLLRVRVAGLDFATAYCPNGKTRCGTTSPARTGTPRSSSAATSTSCRRRSTAGRGMPPTVRYSARPRSGSRYRSLLDLGLTDLFRHLYPEERKFSWWDYRGGSFHRGMGCASTCCSAPRPWSRACAVWRSTASTARRRTGARRPITRRCSRIWIDRTQVRGCRPPEPGRLRPGGDVGRRVSPSGRRESSRA